MNSNTTTLGSAGTSTGAAAMIVVIVVWLLSLWHIEVPPDIAAAIGGLLSIFIHTGAVTVSPTSPVNVPVEQAGNVEVPVKTTSDTTATVTTALAPTSSATRIIP